jgi:hypothetical protein
MQMKKIALLITTLLLPVVALAQVVQVKGVGTVSYVGKASPEIKGKAYVKAQMAAIERYFAESGEADSENFDGVKSKVEADIDNYLLGTAILNEEDLTNFSKYTVAVRVDLNVTNLKRVIRGASTVAKTHGGAKSQLVYLFVGREADTVRSFDDRVFKRVDASASGTKKNFSVQVESGGSTTRKSDNVTYKILPMSNYTTAITSVFSQGGFIVVDPAYAIGDKEFKTVTKDFSSGNDLAPATMRSVVGTLRGQQVPYLVLATLDVDAPSQDMATGLPRVAVTVTARVLDLTNQFPREVASVPAVQYFGMGQTNTDATVKGLKDASLAAARDVVSRLNAADIR